MTFKPGAVYLLKDGRYFLCVNVKLRRDSDEHLQANTINGIIGVSYDMVHPAMRYVSLNLNGEQICFVYDADEYLAINQNDDILSDAEEFKEINTDDFCKFYYIMLEDKYRNRENPDTSILGSIVYIQCDTGPNYYIFVLNTNIPILYDFIGFAIDSNTKSYESCVAYKKHDDDIIDRYTRVISHLDPHDYITLVKLLNAGICPNMESYVKKYLTKID